MKKRELFPSLMLTVSAVCWGLSYSFQSIMADVLEPFTITFMKGFGGSIILIYCYFVRRKFDKRTILIGSLIGVVNGTGLLLQQIALSRTEVSKVGFITILYVVFVPLMLMLENKKPKKSFWFGLAIACVGLYLLCVNETLTFASADLIALFAAMLFALQIILIGKYSGDSDPIVLTGFQQAATATMCGIAMVLTETVHFADFKGIWFEILYTIFISGLLSYLLQNIYQSKVDTNVASLIMSLESVFGAIGGILILHQMMSVREIIGSVLVFISIIIARK